MTQDQRGQAVPCAWAEASRDVVWDTERHVHADREDEENMGGSG